MGTVTCRSSPSRLNSGCCAHVHRHVQVPRASAARARMAEARHAQPVAVGDAGRHRDRHRLAARHHARATAGRASRVTLPPGPGAPVAGLREHHVAAARSDRARAAAGRTRALGHRHHARARAPAARVPADERKPDLRAAHRVLEAQRDRRVQIGAVDDRLRGAADRVLDDVGEQIAERRRRVPAGGLQREIEPFETERRRSVEHGRRQAVRVVLPAAFRIRQDLVGVGDEPEPHGGRAVARVDVRVEAPGQPPVRALDLLKPRGRAARRSVRRGPWQLDARQKPEGPPDVRQKPEERPVQLNSRLLASGF